MTEAAPAKLPRNETLDGLKYVAAALIVLHHVSAIVSGSRMGAFVTAAAVTALYFFFAVSGYLHGPVGGRGGGWLLNRFKRLAVPYAFWSVVYLIWAQRALLSGGKPFLPNVFVLVFFAGAHGILWFLPMLLFCDVVTDLAVRTPFLRRAALAVSLALLVAIVGTGFSAAIQDVTWTNFVLAPLWLVAYLGGMEVRASAGVWRVPAAAGWLGVLAALGAGAVRVRFGAAMGPAASLAEMALWVAGALLVLWGAAAGLRWLGAAKLAWGRDYLIGVYLSHVLWLAGFIALVPATSLNPALWMVAGWAFVFAGASATTWLLLRFPLTRPVVL